MLPRNDLQETGSELLHTAEILGNCSEAHREWLCINAMFLCMPRKEVCVALSHVTVWYCALILSCFLHEENQSPVARACASSCDLSPGSCSAFAAATISAAAAMAAGETWMLFDLLWLGLVERLLAGSGVAPACACKGISRVMTQVRNWSLEQ